MGMASSTSEPRLMLDERCNGKPVVRWFLSYAHDDDAEKADFYKRFASYLRTSSKYWFEAWNDAQLVVGESWRERIHQAMQASHLGVLLVSQAFLASEFIGTNELPAFVDGRGMGTPGKRAVPVALRPLDFTNMDLRGLEQRQIFHDNSGKAFAERRARRDHWIKQLGRQVHDLLERYAVIGASSPRQSRPEPPPAHPAEAAGIHGVYSFFSDNEYKELLRTARQVRILQTFIPSTHLESIRPSLVEALMRAECSVEVLVCHPRSPACQIRQNALGTVAKVRTAVEDNLMAFGKIHGSLPAHAQQRLHVKAYKTLPSLALYQADEVFVFGIYFHEVLAIAAPQIRVLGQGTMLGKQLSHEFETIWKLATTTEVDLADPKHWIDLNG